MGEEPLPEGRSRPAPNPGGIEGNKRGNSYGAFQTKGHFRDRADLGLVRLGASRLRRFLEARPGLEVHMAFPGIGLGGLDPREVLEALEEALAGVGNRVVLYRL
ncbi:hypothetical protein CSW47_04095 [Thermus scotoductus]|uniref:Macro domain-containing protein n=1 Tax=Thermus scotoductus TaxID=37636 RepID=A0A430REW4_THESC|nr:hypothetical protein CSW47_04095 [Thermus scotoductus]